MTNQAKRATRAQYMRERRAQRANAEKELARLKLKEELKAELRAEHKAQGFCPVCGAWPRKQKEEKAKLRQLSAATTEVREDVDCT